MLYEQNVTLIAHRYAELFEIAKGSLECHRIFRQSKGQDIALYRQFNKLEGKQHLIICVTFSIAAMEAFINHIGYILDNDWQQYEARNFFDQYKRIIFVLENLLVKQSDFLRQFYPDFEAHRKFMRNPVQHPHSSLHDSAYSEKIISDPHDMEHFNVSSSLFLNIWADIKAEDADNSVNGVESSILYIRSELERLFPILLNNNEREDLLRHLIDFPLCAIPIVSGQTSAIA